MPYLDLQALHLRSMGDLSATKVPPLLDGRNHRADSGIGQGQVQGLWGFAFTIYYMEALTFGRH